MCKMLFRAKEVDSGEWVHGFYCPVAFGRFPCRPAIIPKKPMDNGSWEPKEVVQDTIGQYIGLTDKNGTRIFEGDIIKHYNNDPEHEHVISSIIWNCDICKFQKRNLDGLSYGISKECKYEVIGNIYDNPELLVGENNG